MGCGLSTSWREESALHNPDQRGFSLFAQWLRCLQQTKLYGVYTQGMVNLARLQAVFQDLVEGKFLSSAKCAFPGEKKEGSEILVTFGKRAES